MLREGDAICLLVYHCGYDDFWYDGNPLHILSYENMTSYSDDEPATPPFTFIISHAFFSTAQHPNMIYLKFIDHVLYFREISS